MRLKVLGSLAIAAALTIGLASPAAAKTVTIYDEIGDEVVGVGAPIAPLDLYSIDVEHTKKKLTVTATFFNTPRGVTFADRWTTARLRLETTGDKKSDYAMQARKLNNSDFARPPKDPIATFFYGPKDELIAQSADASKKNAGKFAFGSEKAGPATLTFSVPLKAIGNPAKIKFNLWVDLTDGSYARYFGLETYPNVKSGGSLGWSKPITLSKDQPAAKKKTTTTIDIAKTTIRRGQTARVVIKVKQDVAGTATVYDGKSKLGTVAVAKGVQATFLLKSLSSGSHDITAKFKPKGKKFKASTSKAITLAVR